MRDPEVWNHEYRLPHNLMAACLTEATYINDQRLLVVVSNVGNMTHFGHIHILSLVHDRSHPIPGHQDSSEVEPSTTAAAQTIIYLRIPMIRRNCSRDCEVLLVDFAA
jgi:hypothetical protein